MNGIIYLTQNLVNGKIYVGIHTRGDKGYLGSGTYLRNAIKKYGQKNFQRIVVDEFNTIEEGCVKERFWIRELKAGVPNGYNLCGGGKGIFNPCQEVRDKYRERMKSDKNPMRRPEIAIKQGLAMLGKPSGNKGKHLSDAAKAKMRALHLGKRHSDITRAKMREHSAMKLRPEIRAKVSGENNHMFGKHHSDATREKLSELKRGKPWSFARRAAEDIRCSKLG